VPEKFDFNQKGWIKTAYESCPDFNLRRFSHFDLRHLIFWFSFPLLPFESTTKRII
jgi:hypothetical protein